jgi:hypothetical protein
MESSNALSSSFPVADNATTFPTWNITVNDTAPIWAYVNIPHFLCIDRSLHIMVLTVPSKDPRQPLWLWHGLVRIHNPFLDSYF